MIYPPKILLEYQQFVKDKSATNCPLSDNMVAGIELLSLLRASGCSLMLYEKIIYWIEKQIPQVMTDCLLTREKIIKIMEDRPSLQCVAPQKKEAVLPSINMPIEIPYNPILGCIYSLLSDENLMHSVNLIFPDPKQPFKAVPFTNNYSEVNSGLAYQSFQKRIKHFVNAIQVPLLFFIDGTAIDRACRHSQTPVMFTLGIFKQLLRNQSKAWRNLGFVKNNIKEQYSRQEIRNATRNTRNYPKSHDCYVPPNHNDFHAQIRCLSNDLLCLHNKKGELSGFLPLMVRRALNVVYFSLFCFLLETQWNTIS